MAGETMEALGLKKQQVCYRQSGRPLLLRMRMPQRDMGEGCGSQVGERERGIETVARGEESLVEATDAARSNERLFAGYPGRQASRQAGRQSKSPVSSPGKAKAPRQFDFLERKARPHYEGRWRTPMTS